MSEPEEDFAALFEATQKTKKIARGQTIEGTVVAIGAEVALVDVGGKGEAVIDVAELKNEEGALEVSVGERIQAVVTSTERGITLSRKLALNAAGVKQLEDAFRAGLPVEGKVEHAVKGGYEVRIARQRAFCPFSQIDIVRTADAAQHEGRVYTFRITEYNDDGRNLVVSRRAILEEQQREKAAEIRETIVEGAVITGRVVSVREFGAFVDLGGGVQGLLHISEMGWTRVADPSQIVRPGDDISVKVLRVDRENQRISLGLKQLLGDPWQGIEERYKPGELRNGRVTRVTTFGVFVELEAGIEGLVPAAETGVGRDGDLKRAFPVGQSLQVVVVEVDVTKRRMGLSIRAVQEAHEAEHVREYQTRPDGPRGEGFGALADKLRDAMRPRTDK